jgi:E3 ubiquitin-protein ligase UBR7
MDLAGLDPDAEVSMQELVAEQDRLADEALEAMPYAFDECSYSKGYLSQKVWSCLGKCGKLA